MSIDVQMIVYLCSNLFRTYVICRFFNLFLDKKNISEILYIICALSFFMLNSMAYIFKFSPYENMIINLVLMFILTFLYKGKAFPRLVITSLVYAVNLFSENIVYRGLLNFNIEIENIISISYIAINLMMFLVILVLEKCTDLKNNKKVTFVNWCSIFLIPFVSIFIDAVLLSQDRNNILNVISAVGLLFINLLVFYLYDILLEFYDDKYKHGLLIQQNKAYLNQFDVIRKSEDSIRILRRDFKNHMIILNSMAEEENNQGIVDYLKSMESSIELPIRYINTGHGAVDSILNYKIDEILHMGVEIHKDISLPKIMKIKYFDICIILGNLLDNAKDALSNVENGYLNIDFKFDKSLICITIINSYSGKIFCAGNRLNTAKEDKNEHGFGLVSVRNAVEKYSGTLEVNYDDNRFEVSILMYNR